MSMMKKASKTHMNFGSSNNGGTELIFKLKERNRALEDQLKEQSKIIDEYQKGDLGSESKIKALNEMHSQKVKALLKSIQNLKKDLQREKLLQKDNIRVQRIEKLNSELHEQEMIINALRKEIGSEDKCDQAILKALNAGPARIRQAAREELKIQNKKLRNQVLILREQCKKKGIDVKLSRVGDVESIAGESIHQLEEISQTPNLTNKKIMETRPDNMYIESKVKDLEELNQKLNVDLNSKNSKIIQLLDDLEEAKVERNAKDMNIEQCKTQIDNLYKQIKDYHYLQNELIIVNAKIQSLEEDNDGLRSENTKLYQMRTGDDLNQNEVHLENKGLEEKLALLQERLEIERSTNKTENHKIMDQNKRLLKQIEELKNELQKTLQEKQAVINSQSESKRSLDMKLKKLETDLISKNQEIDNLEEELQNYKEQVQEKNRKLGDISKKLDDAQIGFNDKILEIEVYESKISDLEKHIEEQNMEIEQMQQKEAEGAAIDPNTVEQLRRKIKALTKREVDLLEQIEELNERHSREKEQSTASHLVTSQKRSASLNKTENELKIMKQKYEEAILKIKELQGKKANKELDN